MKYIFDVSKKNNKYEIKLEISPSINGFSSTAYEIIECPTDQQNWNRSLEAFLTDIIDNMRLTVKERTEAYENSKILINYIKYSNPQDISNSPIMITENNEYI